VREALAAAPTAGDTPATIRLREWRVAVAERDGDSCRAFVDGRTRTVTLDGGDAQRR